MRDPYNVLGVGRDASDEEIKKKYRALCRKYHPDLNPGNQAAEEVFKEVQQAYQQIMDQKKNGFGEDLFGGFGGYGGSGGSGFGGGQGTYGNSEYDVHMGAAANYIRSGHYREAVHVLDGIAEHTAQWYYFYAVGSSGLGNNAAAQSYAEMAVRLEPGNLEYRGFLSQLQMGQQWYGERQKPYGSFQVGNNFCASVCLLNLCCNLCGGRVFCC